MTSLICQQQVVLQGIIHDIKALSSSFPEVEFLPLQITVPKSQGAMVWDSDE